MHNFFIDHFSFNHFRTNHRWSYLTFQFFIQATVLCCTVNNDADICLKKQSEPRPLMQRNVATSETGAGKEEEDEKKSGRPGAKATGMKFCLSKGALLFRYLRYAALTDSMSQDLFIHLEF